MMSITRNARKGKFLDLTKKDDFHTFRLYLPGIYHKLFERLEETIQHINKSPAQVRAERNKAKDFSVKEKEVEYHEFEGIREKELNQVKLSELKTESTLYFESLYNSETIQQRFPKFNKEKFKGLSNSIDMNGKEYGIPQAYDDLLKGIVLSESCMDKKTGIRPTRGDIEMLYVFPELREAAISASSPMGINPFSKPLSWLIGKAGDLKLWRDGKEHYLNALGPFQMQTALFTKLIAINPELKKEVIQILHQEFSWSSNKDNIVSILEKANADSLDGLKIIMQDRDLLNIMQRLSFHKVAQKVAFAFIKDNEKTLTGMYEEQHVYLDHQDMLLTCGLAHLKGPSAALDAVLQQNVYLLAQSLGIDIEKVLGAGSSYHIDGMIKMPGSKSILVDDPTDSDPHSKILQDLPTEGGETWKLFQVIKNELDKRGLHMLQNVELEHIMPTKGSTCRENMIDRFKDCELQLTGKGIQFHFEPLLSVCDLKPLQAEGKIKLRYIFHYLESLQCDPTSEKQKKEYRKKISEQRILSIPGNKKNNSSIASNKENGETGKKTLKINKNENTIKSPKTFDNEKKYEDKSNSSSTQYNSTNNLTFRRFHKQYAKLNEKGELMQGNLSGLNRIKSMYKKQLSKKNNGNIRWSEADIQKNTRLQNVSTYKDIFNDHIKSHSTVIFDKNKTTDSDYISSILTTLLDSAGGDVENIIVGFRKAAKVIEIKKNSEGKYTDMFVSLPLYDKELGRYIIKTMSVFGKGGMIEQFGHVYASILL